MIEIDALDEAYWEHALSRPGGFGWWYVDLVDERGDGMVLIWSLGLPFLAGSRRALPPRERPSLNVVIYREGAADCYLLQQYEADQVGELQPNGSATLGRSRVRATESQGLVRLVFDLDEAVPGSSERLQGRVELSGPAAQLSPLGKAVLGSPSKRVIDHLWTPRVIHGRGQARLRCGSTTWEIEGSAYFDGNVSSRPLPDQGIASWRWGRVCLGANTLVIYEIASANSSANQTLVLRATSDGKLSIYRDIPVHWGGTRKGHFGMSSPRTLRFSVGGSDVTCCMESLVDDGPFYQRSSFRAEGLGSSGWGWFEVVRPASIDIGWQRPFVRMRTHHVGQQNSIWLPLFSGSRRGRTSRLLRSWLGTRTREDES